MFVFVFFSFFESRRQPLLTDCVDVEELVALVIQRDSKNPAVHLSATRGNFSPAVCTSTWRRQKAVSAHELFPGAMTTTCASLLRMQAVSDNSPPLGLRKGVLQYWQTCAMCSVREGSRWNVNMPSDGNGWQSARLPVYSTCTKVSPRSPCTEIIRHESFSRSVYPSIFTVVHRKLVHFVYGTLIHRHRPSVSIFLPS